MKKNLIETEVFRCNIDLLITNILFTLFLFWIIMTFLNGFDAFSIILSLLLLSIPVYYFYRLYERFYDFRNHPLYVRFLRFENPSKIGESIENELINNVIFSHGNNVITEHWIVNKTFFDFYAIYCTEVIWAYFTETKHSVNFIPTGTTYGVNINSIYFNTQNKMIKTVNQFDFSSSKEYALNCLMLIQNFAPWAFYGFNDQLKGQWEINPHIMVKEVQSRISSMLKI